MADLRALQDSISRQKGLIPPAQDQFFGQEMKPQRGLVENILRMLSNPSDPGIGPMAMEAPVAGMVLNPKNAEIIKNAIMSLGPKATPLKIAETFIGTKYPRLRSLAGKIAGQRANSGLGKLDLYTNKITAYNPDMQGVERLTGTIGHELTHALQSVRTPEMFKGYVSPKADLFGYMSHPAEIAANQGGATAQSAFKKFMTDYSPFPSIAPDFAHDPAWYDIIKSIMAQSQPK